MQKAPTNEDLFSLAQSEILCMWRSAQNVIDSSTPPTAQAAAVAYATIKACRTELDGRTR